MIWFKSDRDMGQFLSSCVLVTSLEMGWFPHLWLEPISRRAWQVTRSYTATKEMITAPMVMSIQLFWWELRSQDSAAQPLFCSLGARISSQCPPASSSWQWRHRFHDFIVTSVHQRRWDGAQVCLYRLWQMLYHTHIPTAMLTLCRGSI